MPTKTKSSSTPKKNSTAPKYDWGALKLKFFASDALSLEEWIRRELGVPNKNWAISKATNGWAAEREAFRASAMKQAEENLRRKMAEDIYNPSLKELWEMHKATVDLIKVALMGIQQACVVTDKGKKKVIQIPNAQDLKRFWEMIRVEKGQSTDIVWDENFIQSEDELGE